MVFPPGQSGGDTGQGDAKLTVASSAVTVSERGVSTRKATLTLTYKKKLSALLGSSCTKIRMTERGSA